MKVPASTVVMALVTCSLFGVAIRETVRGKKAIATDELTDPGDSASIDVDGAVERELARESERVAEQARRAGALGKVRRDLFGADVASLGPAFGGVALGSKNEGIELTSVEAATETLIATEGEGTVEAIVIVPQPEDFDTREEQCDLMVSELEERWGDSEGDSDHPRWINASTKTRVNVTNSDGSCRVVFDRYVDPAQWFAKTATSIVPVWAVGQPVAKLQASLGPRGTIEWADSYAELAWHAPGLEHGSGQTDLIAYVVQGKVVAVEATATPDTAGAISARLTAMYGVPTTDDDIVYAWSGKPGVTLTIADDRVRLIVGKLPG
jgi:hypothetical protein